MKTNLISPFKRFRLFKKHFNTFFPYLTIGKIFNLILNEYEMRRGVASPRSFPPFIKIDPSPMCNLRCPQCKQNDLDFKKRFNESMNLTLENLRKIIEPLHKKLLGVSFCVNGEPFSNKRLVELISYLHSKKISVNFPSNFSFKFSDEEIENIVKSGLDKIYVSLDGTNEESYLKYRYGGNFKQVMNNVVRVSEIKKKLGKKTPALIWKFVVFDHNKDEADYVVNNYEAHGFDGYRLDYDFTGQITAANQNVHRKDMVENKKKCYWLWNTLAVLWDGTVYPCCNWYFDEDIFKLGNAYQTSIDKIWQGEPYRKLRASFSKNSYGKNMPEFCRKCIGLE